MKKTLVILLLISNLAIAQTELLPSVAWRTYVSNVEMLTDSTYKFDVMPLDWNEAGASVMNYGNYFEDYAGNKYEVIDSAYLSVTVWDLFETGVSPQIDRIGVMYQSPEPNSEYLAPINYKYLDETALDNARAVELAYLWRHANLYAQDSANIVWWNDTIETIATKSDVPIYLTDLDSTSFDIDTSQVRDLGAFVANNSGSASISGTEGYLPKFGASGLTESRIYEDASGKVGIGTTLPSTKLEVYESINGNTGFTVRNDNTGVAAKSYLGIGNTPYSTPYDALFIEHYGTGYATRGLRMPNSSAIICGGAQGMSIGTDQNASLSFFTNGIRNGADVTIFSNGNVGIGTTNPITELHIKKNSVETAITVENDGGIGGAAYEMIDNASGAWWKFKTTSAGDFKIRNHFKGFDVFYIDSLTNEQFSIINNNVGIGTRTPTEKLEVNGNIKADEATELYHVPTYGQAKIDSFWVDGKITYYRQGGELDSIRGDADELEIGDFYQGGYIFYLSEDKETGMVCSPYLGTTQWSPTATLVGGTLSTFGSGGLNTTKIIDEFGAGNYAAYLCTQYSVFGYDDWFLPSTGEASLIYTNLIESGLVDVSILGDTYLSWTSTEQTGSTGAGAVNLTNGTIYVGIFKTGYNGYLAVRQFSTDYSGNLPAAVEEDILVYRNAEWTTLSRGLNGTFLGIEDNKVKYTTPSSSSGVTSVIAGVLVDVSSTTGNVTVNVDLSEATSDNTFSSTDQLIYLSGTAAKKGTVSGLQSYMQNNLDFGTGGGMVYPSAGIPVSTGSSWGSSIANNSSNWNTAYGWGDHSTEGYLKDAPSNGSLYGRKNGAWTVISTGTSAVTSVVAGNLVDVSSTTGDVTVNVDLSEATSDNTFSSTDQLVYLSGTTQKRGTITGLESYMQSNLDFDSEWSTATYGVTYTTGNIGVGTDPIETAAIRADGGIHKGVFGSSSSAAGVYGESTSLYGVNGRSNTSVGVLGESTSGFAGAFYGGLGVVSEQGYRITTSGSTTEVIDANGFTRPKSSTDTNAPNNSIYYSTTQSKLVYKDSGGTVHALY